MGSHLTPEQQKYLATEILFQDEQAIEEGKYRLVFCEYTAEQLAELHKYDHARYQIRAEGRNLAAWTPCPSCGRQVLRKQLLKKGCYLCGWKETRGEDEWGQIRSSSQAEWKGPYRTRCPECGARVIREELAEKGCYVCNWEGTTEDIEWGEIEYPSLAEESAYKIRCPDCGAWVVREQLVEKGCYRCGWKP